MIDFSKCSKSLALYEGGSMNNTSVVYNNHNYLIKFHDSVNLREKQTEIKESYYRNNIICEYVVCHILKEIFNADVQDTLLGVYKDNGKLKDVIACKDFRNNGENIIHFNSLIDSSKTHYNNYKIKTSLSLEDSLEQIRWIKNERQIDLTQHFWNLFIYDMFFGNYDRHGENWGILTLNNKFNRICPIYDCGSTLCGALDITFLYGEINNMNNFDFHNFLCQDNFSAFNLDRNSKNKLTYYEFFSDKIYKLFNEELKNAVINIIPKIDLNKIYKLIDDLQIESVYISEEDILTRKEFIKRMLTIKFHYLMEPLYNKIIKFQESKLLLNKVMSQYKFNKTTGDIKEIKKENDSYWNIRKDRLQSCIYKTNPLSPETKYNIENYDEYCIISAFDIKSIDIAKEIIIHELKSIDK